MSTADQLLTDILAFCERHKTSETAFGVASCGDGHLVRRLRAGKSVTTKRLDEVRGFMKAQDEASRPVLASSGDGPSGAELRAAS